MEEKNQQIEQLIGSFVGKILRDYFGKGPESVYVSIGFTFLTIYLRNFIAPMERVLMEQDQFLIVNQMREKLMNSLIPEIKAYIEIVTGNPIREFYYDWGMQNRSGLIAAVASEPFKGVDQIEEHYYGKEKTEYEIFKISELSQKAPDEIYSFEINSRTLLVIREGILVRIEKELIRLGYRDLLKSVKRNLEKSCLHNSSHFETILLRKVSEIFVDWNLDEDKSVIVFILNQRKPAMELGQK